MYWPGMMSDIQDIVEQCEICAVSNKKTNNKELFFCFLITDDFIALIAVNNSLGMQLLPSILSC